MRNFLLFTIFTIATVSTQAQVGINTITPQATLDIRAINHLGSASPEDGLLVPRVSDLPNAGMEDGQLLFLISDWTDDNGTISDTTDDIIYTKGFHYWDNDLTSWSEVFVPGAPTTSSHTAGDVKHGFQNADHNGWYLLDGRAISSLPTAAQTAASSLGFTGALPDATDRVLKAVGSSENLGDAVGANNITLAAANIPELVGSTDNDGEHNHSYTDYVGVFSTTTPGASGQPRTSSRLDAYGYLTETTSDAGDHNHSFTVGNSAPTALDTTPASIATNVFIYLGN